VIQVKKGTDALTGTVYISNNYKFKKVSNKIVIFCTLLMCNICNFASMSVFR